jgi:hypothetical protein
LEETHDSPGAYQNNVHQKDFLDALEKIVLGLERSLVPGADPVNRKR